MKEPNEMTVLSTGKPEVDRSVADTLRNHGPHAAIEILRRNSCFLPAAELALETGELPWAVELMNRGFGNTTKSSTQKA
jgi:hypothetical protein